MPAAIVFVKQQRQRQQQQQQQQRQSSKQYFNINICERVRSCDVGADAAATNNAGHAVDVDVAAATTATAKTTTTTTTRAVWRNRAQQRSAKVATTSTPTSQVVIIIMALVLGIMQQQQQLHWLFCNGLYAAAETYNNNNNNNNSNNNSSSSSSDSYNNIPQANVSANDVAGLSSFVAGTAAQPEATNHTFKSLAFLVNAADSFGSFATSASAAVSSSSSSSSFSSASSTVDGFAVAAETKFGQSMPIFDFGMPRNITGRTGHTEAIIKCRVDSLLDKSVSWIRKRDLHILTVGTATYTSDKRFQVTESKDTRDWTLHVKSPLAKDSGIYECQVNTEPKMSMAFQLNIIEISPDAKAIISGPHDLHFKAGSAIILNCVVKQPSIKDIGPIYWYRGEHMITPFDADDAEAGASTELQRAQQKELTPRQLEQALNDVLSTDLQKDFATRIAMESQLGDTLKSRLRISNAQTTDTGNYTCQPTTASSASVLVHVINDENPAAMQKSGATLPPLFGQSWQQRFGLMCSSVLVLALQWAKY